MKALLARGHKAKHTPAFLKEAGRALGTSMLKALLLIAILAAGQAALAASSNDDTNGDLSQELEGLGSNKQVNDRVNRLKSGSRIGIVQGRAVDRHWRVELGAAYGPAAFGDSYYNSQELGANLDLHINPRFSLGVHYAKVYNQLTDEGQSRFNAGRNTFTTTPQVSYGEQSVMGILNWYMTYGKINLFDWRVVQFDIYSLAGYGEEQVATAIGPNTDETWTGAWTAGAGIGFWFSQHVTSRIEVRYKTYADQGGSRNLNLVVGSVGLGVLL